jgi:hypothetical protein
MGILNDEKKYLKKCIKKIKKNLNLLFNNNYENLIPPNSLTFIQKEKTIKFTMEDIIKKENKDYKINIFKGEILSFRDYFNFFSNSKILVIDKQDINNLLGVLFLKKNSKFICLSNFKNFTFYYDKLNINYEFL